jgi:proline iminopeptidase
MLENPWQEHRLQIADLELRYSVRGAGEVLVLLSGGPGDPCDYLQQAHENLTSDFTCVALDQRGTGKSRLEFQNPTTLDAMKFVDDLEALREHLKLEKLNLLGHSWGANLAMLYAAVHPTRAAKVAAIAPGPINDLMGSVAGSNFNRGFSTADFAELAKLREKRQIAFEAGNLEELRALHFESTARFWTRNAIFSNEARAKFNAVFSAEDFNPTVNKLAWKSYSSLNSEHLLSNITADLLVLYGFQDFEPITQAYLIREKVSHAKLEFINDCGHVPWLEQPTTYYDVLTKFLN